MSAVPPLDIGAVLNARQGPIMDTANQSLANKSSSSTSTVTPNSSSAQAHLCPLGQQFRGPRPTPKLFAWRTEEVDQEQLEAIVAAELSHSLRNETHVESPRKGFW